VEARQRIRSEVTIYSVEVEFNFDCIEGDYYEDYVDAAVDEGLRGFYEKGYHLIDHDEFFQKDHAGNWKGTYVAFIERVDESESD